MSMDLLKPHPVLGTYAIRGIPTIQTLTEATEGFDKVVIFNDFNNLFSGTYYPQFAENVLNFMMVNNNQMPSIIVTEWLKYQRYIEEWAKSQNKQLKSIYHSESGRSFYHENIYKNYKSARKNRTITLPLGLMNYFDNDMSNIFKTLSAFMTSSWDWITKIAMRCNIATFRLRNLDSDFIPEFLFRRVENFFNDDTCYIILSTDGDMLQLLDFGPNVKIINSSKIIDQNNWMTSKSYLKSCLSNIDHFVRPDRVLLYKATVGDTSDGIKGIKGIGGKIFARDLIDIDEDIDCDDLNALKKYFESHPENDTMSKILSNWKDFEICMKLVSFRHLIEYLYYIPDRNEKLMKMLDENDAGINGNASLLDISVNNKPINIYGL